MQENLFKQNRITAAGKIAVFLILISLSELIFKSEQFFYPVVGTLLIIFYFRKKWPLFKKNYTILMLMYMFYSLYSSLWSPAIGIEKFLFIKFAVLFTLILQLQLDYTKKDAECIKNAFVLQLLGLIGIIAIWGHFEVDGRLWIQSAAPVDPNSLSSWLIIPTCLIVDKFFTCPHKMLKPLYLILIAVCIGLAFLCASRAGVISVIFCVVSSFLYAMKNTIRHNIGMAFAISIIGLIIIGLALYNMPESVIARFEYGNTAELGGRAIIWNELFNAMLMHPLNIIIGFGESATVVYSDHVAHNLFIETLFCQGLVGLTLLIMFVLAIFINAIKKDPYWGIALLGMMMMSNSLSEFTSRPVMLSFFLAGFTMLKSTSININRKLNAQN